MSFKDKLINDVIKPHSSQNLSNSIGKIIEIDEKYNKAKVLVSSSGAFTVLEDVPIQLSGKGMVTSKLEEDDLVYVQYNSGSVFQPKIVGFADEDYNNNTREKTKHTRKGTLLNVIEEREGELKPRAYRRVDKDSDSYKHSEYMNVSPTEAIGDKIESIGYFNNYELGLFHPILSSVVKLKDNGDIDIFTGTNVGIRINREKKTIQTFGDSLTLSDNWKVLSNNVTVIAEETVNIECDTLKLKTENIFINEERLDV